MVDARAELERANDDGGDTMTPRFYDEQLRSLYENELEHAAYAGFTAEELAETSLSNPGLKTTSKRLMRKFELAYFIGVLVGIFRSDRWLNERYVASGEQANG